MKKIIFVIVLFFCVKVYASIAVMDENSGRILYEKSMNEKHLIASTTKIMTCIIALENASLYQKITVGDEINTVDGSMIYVKKGEVFYLKDLLYGLMLRSGNDAAVIIANNVRNYNEFIAKMNMKAYSLGMYNTYFENPHGLDYNSKNYSTAYDLCLLMKYALKNKDFLKITQTTKYEVGKYTWYNKNKLLTSYKYTIAGKIGYTKSSGQVFVSSAKKNNKTLIIATVDEPDKFNLHKRLYEKYFELYDRYKILDKYMFSFKQISDDKNHYYIKNDFYMLLKEKEKNKIQLQIELNNDFNYINVLYDRKVIHKEKIYRISLKEKIKNLKNLLLFNK